MSFTPTKTHEKPKHAGGRPRKTDPKVREEIFSTQRVWDYIALWKPTANRSGQFEEMMERVMKFWPHGPEGFAHPGYTGPRRRPLPRRLDVEAAKRGTTPRELNIEILEAYWKEHGE